MVLKLMLVALGAAGSIAVGSNLKVWTATLTAKDSSGVSGSARIETIHDDSVKATVTLSGAAPNTAIDWGIHSGKCSAPGAKLGEGATYQAVQADSTGSGSAMATLKLEMKSGTDYSVVVHGSAKDSVAACGELKPGSDIPN